MPREITTVLKTLRLNLIPSPRVITPGPATKFPVTFAREDGSEAVVRSLKDVRAGAFHGGFFVERLPIEETRSLYVAGYSTSGPRPAGGDITELAVRAAYCLGLDRAVVEVGLGSGGPWVLNVRETPTDVPKDAPAADDLPAAPQTPPAFLGARVEYLLVDPVTGEPEHQFYMMDISPDCPANLLGIDGFTWTSSPMPFPEMPLTTRLQFSGAPDPSFVRFLDGSVAVLGMLVSPAEEARERHATDEGLLGSVRLLADVRGFEYLPIPSLLWSPTALRGLVAAVSAICANWQAVSRKQGTSRLGLEERYQAQRAYYHGDKDFFGPAVASIAALFDDLPLSRPDALAIRDLITLAADAASGGTVPAPASAPVVARAPASSVTGPALPVLGIMSPVEDGPHRFGIETDRFREIVKAAAAQGVLAYVFFPDSRDTVYGAGNHEGWLFREKKGWFPARVPVPDVVYDRHIPDIMSTGEIRDVAREVQEAHPATQFINSLEMVRACRDKFRAYNILSQAPLIARYLPLTIVAGDPAAVALFASQRKRTYLKLRGGTGSRGLVLIENLTAGLFKIERRQPDGTSAESAAGSQAQLQDLLAGILRSGEGPAWEYIAQDGIDLARAPGPGEVFEVRVICQKGGAGVWLRTGMVCRFNPVRGRFMIPREELHLKVDDLLGQIFPGRVAAIKDEVREIARRIPPVLEAGSGRGGEMSVDVGIDTAGKPHLIEVNSKPATLFRDIAAFELRQLSLRRVVNYAIRLFDER